MKQLFASSDRNHTVVQSLSVIAVIVGVFLLGGLATGLVFAGLSVGTLSFYVERVTNGSGK